MSITQDENYIDEINNAYLAGSISVSTSQVLAKVGASPLANRKSIRIYNNSNITIYFGPAGLTSLTGEPIFKNQWMEMVVTGDILVYLITASGTASDVRIQELS